MATVCQKLQESNVCSDGEQINQLTIKDQILQLRCVLFSRHWTQDRWLQSIQTIMIWKSWPQSLLAWQQERLLTLCFMRRGISRSSKAPPTNRAYTNLIWDRFCKKYLPTLHNRQKWRSTTNEALKEGDLAWLIEDSNKRGCCNLGPVTETIYESVGVIRSPIVRTNDGTYKTPVKKLAPVLPGRDVVAIENRADDVVAELKNSRAEWNNASPPFQAVKSE